MKQADCDRGCAELTDFDDVMLWSLVTFSKIHFHRVNAQVIDVESCVCYDVDFGVGFDIGIWCKI